MRNLRITLITGNQKLGNKFAVCLPFVGVFNLRVVTRITPFQSLRYEMVYVTKLLEIHQRRVCKDILKEFGLKNYI